MSKDLPKVTDETKSRDDAKVKRRLRYLANRDRELAQQKIYNQTHRKERAAYLRRYNRERRKKDPSFKLAHNLRVRTRNALRGLLKTSTTLLLIGCDLDFFKKYLETKFKPGMSWENYGNAGWHIDHIRPVSSFDLMDPDQQKVCFHYTNLQPLWAAENFTKSDKYTPCNAQS